MANLGKNVTVSGKCRRAIVTFFFLFLPKMEDLNFAVNSTLVGEEFISRLQSFNWPPRSGDLTALLWFLWRYVVAHIYCDKPSMKANIEEFISEMTTNMFERA